MKDQLRGSLGLASVHASDYAQGIPFGEYVVKANAEVAQVRRDRGGRCIAINLENALNPASRSYRKAAR